MVRMKQINANSTLAQTSASPRDTAAPQFVPRWTLPEGLREYEHEKDGGGSSFLAGLIECFLSDTEGRLRILRQAVWPADLPTLCKEFHTLKGSAGSLGAYDLAGLCRDAEE